MNKMYFSKESIHEANIWRKENTNKCLEINALDTEN